MKFNPLCFLLLTAGDSLSPPQARSRQTYDTSLLTTPQTQCAQPLEADTEKQRRRRRSQQQWGRKIEFRAKKTRPLSHLSLEELKALTDSHLNVQSNDAVGESADEIVSGDKMNKRSSTHQINELKNLVSAWSKLASAGYISSKRSDETDADAILLTKSEMRMAAEMAEKCLKHLIAEEKYENITNDIVSVDLYHLVRSLLSICTFLCPITNLH